MTFDGDRLNDLLEAATAAAEATLAEERLDFEPKFEVSRIEITARDAGPTVVWNRR